MKQYRITRDFRSPKKGSDPLVFFTFKNGDPVAGTETRGVNSMVLVTAKGFVIPMAYLEEAEISAPASAADASGALPADIKEKVQTAADKDIIKTIVKNSQKCLVAALIGGSIGLGYAIGNGKNKLMFSVGGLIIGGAIGYLLMNKKTE